MKTVKTPKNRVIDTYVHMSKDAAYIKEAQENTLLLGHSSIDVQEKEIAIREKRDHEVHQALKSPGHKTAKSFMQSILQD